MSVQQYLERLFTWESLENTERGVEFELKNRLVEAELHEIGQGAIDGEQIPPEKLTLELSDGSTVPATAVSEADPIPFDLAETVQVIADVPRLRRGTHEVGVTMAIEGWGMVSFEIDDDVNGKERKTAIEAIEDRLATARAEAPEEIEFDGSEKSSGGSIVEELLVDILESPQRVSVYLSARRRQPTTPEAVASDLLFSEEAVEKTLGDFEMEGIAERNENDEYEVVSPVAVIRKRQNQLWNILSRGL